MRIAKYFKVLVLAAFLLFAMNVTVFASATDELGTWEKESTIPATGQKSCHMVTYGDKIFFLGFYTDFYNYSQDLYAYDPVAKTWEKKAPMPVSLHSADSIISSSGKIYVFGGASGGKAVNSLYVYDIKTNTWENRGVMPFSNLIHLGVAELNGLFYVGGGINYSGSYAGLSKQFYSYDPNLNKWTRLADMNTPIAAVLDSRNGKIYALALHDYAQGSTATNSGESDQVYDIATGTWAKFSNSPVKERARSVVITKDNIYAFYANNGLYKYSFSEQKWTLLHTFQGIGRLTYFNGKLYFVSDGATMYLYVSGALPDNTPPDQPRLFVLLEEDEQVQLIVKKKLPANKLVFWASSDTSVATVDENGLVTAVSQGTCVINVTTEDGSYTDIIYIKVLETADDYRLSVHLYTGEKCRLWIDDDINNIVWSSADETIATVDKSGLVTAKGKGLVIITATINGQEHFVYVRVSDNLLNDAAL